MRDVVAIQARLDAISQAIETAVLGADKAADEFLRAERDFKEQKSMALLEAEGNNAEAREADALLRVVKNGAYEAWIVAKAKHSARKEKIDLLQTEATILQSRLKDHRG